MNCLREGERVDAFGCKLEEAAKSKTANRGAEAIADEVAAPCPFHLQLKNLVALFKENYGTMVSLRPSTGIRRTRW